MATKKAILQAYCLISANAPLVKAQNDKDLAILLRSWMVAFTEVDDVTLGYGVERFIKEVTEVNRAMVISAKILELCRPKEKPFNEYIVAETVNRMLDAYRSEKAWFVLKAETDPLLFEIIENYPFSVIRETSIEQMPTVYAQIRNDYRLRHMARMNEEHNKRLEQVRASNNNLLLGEKQ